jgi:NAD(P)-dependent dehydrogenase (short-subunit alcohol dehydrogenase family)
MIMRLKDRVAVVTGGAQGIGEAIASRLAEEGAKVAILDIRLELAQEVAQKLKGRNFEALALKADMCQKTEIQAAVNDVASAYGGIDILVNNAGYHRMSKVTDIAEEIWDKIIDTNLKGYFLMIQAVVPYMQVNNYGKILNIASAAVYGGMTEQLHYVASKGGVVSMTRALALELAPSKINVNAVCPGGVETPGNKKFLAQFKELLVQRVPLGRIAQPDDIASAVLFLVSDEAEYITGQCLPVCGGVTIGLSA